MRIAQASAVLLWLACGTVPKGQPTPSVAQAAQGRRVVLVTAWARCADGGEDPTVRGFLSAEMQSIANRLSKIAVDTEVVSLWNPDSTELLAAIDRDARPLWLAYSGHGTREGMASVLCLRDRTIAEAEIVARRPHKQAYATYFFNTCQSAYVDIRRANAVVISAGPERVGNEHNETVVGGDLRRALEKPLDADGNGIVDSRELFQAVDQVHVAEQPAQLKMQAQSWAPLPLFFVTAGGLEPDSEMPADLATREREFRAGLWAPDVDAPTILWSVPEELDGLGDHGPTIRRAGSLTVAQRLAERSLSARVFRVVNVNGSLAVQDLATGQTVWQRAVEHQASAFFSGRDLENVFEGFESQDEGDRRRYLRPVSSRQRLALAKAGFVAVSCLESIGQCFTRTPSTGAPP